MNNKKVELLSPAGDIERGIAALDYGADAIYLGAKMYSLRARASNFDYENIKKMIEYAHSKNKKVYIVTNILCHNGHMAGFIPFIKKILEYKPDGFICADPYIISKIREIDKNVEVHVSTQQSTTNSYAAKFWKRNSCNRVVLAREVSFNELLPMCKECINKNIIDIEYFIHGAVCIGYSGRCMLSDYYCLRNANFGGCAQSCRWVYTLFDENKIYSNHFSMSAKDMCQLPNLKQLIDAKINSLKIEGRMKTEHYIATVNQVYGNAINDIYQNGNLTKKQLNEYINELDKVANRETNVAWFNGLPNHEAMLSSEQLKQVSQLFIFTINKKVDDYTYEINSRNYFTINDDIEVIGPNHKLYKLTINKIVNKDNEVIEIVNKPMQKYLITFNEKVNINNNDIGRIVIK